MITLRDVEGWSAEEVCELLGLSDGNQRVLLHRARLQVRDALAGYVDPHGQPVVRHTHPRTARGTALRPPTRHGRVARPASS